MSELGGRADSLAARAAEGGAQFFFHRPLIIDIQKDVGLYVRLPFTQAVTEDLRRILTMLVEHITEDLASASGGVRRIVSTPDELRKLQKRGEDILADLDIYAEYADHYHTDKAREQRINRPFYETSREIDAISDKAKELRKKIVDYLGDLARVIKEISDGDGASIPLRWQTSARYGWTIGWTTYPGHRQSPELAVI